MKELNFAQNFAVIALNNQRSSELTNSKKVSLRCIAAATILELYLNDLFIEVNSVLTFERMPIDSTQSMYQNTVLDGFVKKGKDAGHLLEDYLEKVSQLSRGNLELIEQAFVYGLLDEDALIEQNSLLSCDLEFETAGITVKEYQANQDVYRNISEAFRADVLEKGFIPDESVLLLWLCKESGCLYELFSKDELKRVAERFEDLLETNPLAISVFPINIHKQRESLIKRFLKLKSKIIATSEGSGVNFLFPMIERSQAVFIDTETYFSKATDRLAAVEARLKKHNIDYKLVKDGDVPLIKVAHVLYDAVPYAKRYRVPVHGVQLRRYPLSI